MSVEFNWDGLKVTDALKEALFEGLSDAGQYLLDEAQKRVPLNTGLLQSTGELSADRSKMTTAVQYGDRDRNCYYAAFVHEHPEKNFQHGREGKWLEHTFDLYGETAVGRLAKTALARFNK